MILLLVLANLLFLGWSYWIDRPRAVPAGTANVPPLRLAPAAAAAGGAGAGAGAVAGGAAPPAMRCASLGPIDDAAAAAVVNTALRARNFNPRQREAPGVIADGYWVYIDELRDAAARERALRRLARAGVHDAAALASSGQVSVGLFSEQAGAQLRAATVRAAGLVPVIEARSHPVREIWFDVDMTSDVPLPSVAALVAGLNLAAAPAWGACPAAPAAGAAAPDP